MEWDSGVATVSFLPSQERLPLCFYIYYMLPMTEGNYESSRKNRQRQTL